MVIFSTWKCEGANWTRAWFFLWKQEQFNDFTHDQLAYTRMTVRFRQWMMCSIYCMAWYWQPVVQRSFVHVLCTKDWIRCPSSRLLRHEATRNNMGVFQCFFNKKILIFIIEILTYMSSVRSAFCLPRSF